MIPGKQKYLQLSYINAILKQSLKENCYAAKRKTAAIMMEEDIMFKVNDNYQKLPGSYLFSTIAKKVSAFSQANPDKNIIRLGIGDVTQPIAPAIIDAMHKAVDEMGNAATFHGYAPDLGYEFLRSAIAKNDYQARGCDISTDEIFVSDGAKSDSGNIQEMSRHSFSAYRPEAVQVSARHYDAVLIILHVYIVSCYFYKYIGT